MNYADQEALNRLHLEDPKPGDYWHELFSVPYLVVLSVLASGNLVIVEDYNADGFQLDKAKEIPKEKLAEFVKYENRDGFVADVIAEKLTGVVRLWETSPDYHPLVVVES
jgi:hypothetical protein